MGSARHQAASKDQANRRQKPGFVVLFYDAAHELSRRLTTWSKTLDPSHRRFVVCTGGGPGSWKPLTRGAADAQGVNIGLTISIPVEFDNPFITDDLRFSFHYFFMRKSGLRTWAKR